MARQSLREGEIQCVEHGRAPNIHQASELLADLFGDDETELRHLAADAAEFCLWGGRRRFEGDEFLDGRLCLGLRSVDPFMRRLGLNDAGDSFRLGDGECAFSDRLFQLGNFFRLPREGDESTGVRFGKFQPTRSPGIAGPSPWRRSPTLGLRATLRLPLGATQVVADPSTDPTVVTKKRFP